MSNDTVFRDSDGNIIEGAQAGYDKNTGVIYITEDVAGKPSEEFNRIVGEEIGELYAHKNGLASETGGAEQIGQIFGKEMSKGKDSDSEYTGTIVVNNNIKDVKVDGTDAVLTSSGTSVSAGPIKAGVTGDFGFIYDTNTSKIRVVGGFSLSTSLTEELGISADKSVIYFPTVTKKEDLGDGFFTYSVSAEIGEGLGMSGGFSILIPVKDKELDFSKTGIGLDVGAGVGLNVGATFGPGFSTGFLWNPVSIPVPKKITNLREKLTGNKQQYLNIINNSTIQKKAKEQYERGK